MMAALIAAGCADDDRQADEDIPDGCGRLTITISTPEAIQTRAVDTTNPWLQGTTEERTINSYHLLVCNGSTILQVLSGGTLSLGDHQGDPKNYFPSTGTLTTDYIPIGTYDFTFYCLANFTADMMTATGLTVNSDGVVTSTTLPDGFETRVMRPIANGTSTVPSTGLPMTGKLTKHITITKGTTTTVDDPLILWRMMAKMEFIFTNEASEQIKVYGIEVEPINQIATTGDDAGKGLIYLFSQDDLTSTKNLAPYGVNLEDAEDDDNDYLPTVTLPTSARTNVGKVIYENVTPTTPLLTLDDYTGTKPTGTLFFYVNESDATYTVTQNQFSLRFKIKRGNGTEEELRYGMTTPYVDGTTGKDGFNVIRRNDWIHIPIVLTDWQFRVEPLAFVPIAGYPAKTLSSDALTATFSTGGMIALQPFVKKKGDKSWRDYGDPRITNMSISWKNSDGENIAYYNSDGTVKDGDTTDESDKKIVKTAFEYDSVTKSIIGELDNTLPSGTYKTTFTVNAQLDNYPYSFTFNVILQK